MRHIKKTGFWTREVRDFVLFLGGLAGVAYETLVEQVDRPALLALFAGMLGLPLFLQRDEKPSDDDPAPPTHAKTED